jgi:hypothetical protein
VFVYGIVIGTMCVGAIGSTRGIAIGATLIIGTLSM